MSLSDPILRLFSCNVELLCTHAEEPKCRTTPNSKGAVKAMFRILQIQYNWKYFREKKVYNIF